MDKFIKDVHDCTSWQTIHSLTSSPLPLLTTLNKHHKTKQTLSAAWLSGKSAEPSAKKRRSIEDVRVFQRYWTEKFGVIEKDNKKFYVFFVLKGLFEEHLLKKGTLKVFIIT